MFKLAIQKLKYVVENICYSEEDAWSSFNFLVCL
jgi:hypothetical protein